VIDFANVAQLGSECLFSVLPNSLAKCEQVRGTLLGHRLSRDIF
jgi:hypothetical protein